jgi:hypothetical protein
MKKTKKLFIVGVVIILLTTTGGLTFLFNKGKDFKGTDEFVKELKSRNYTVESILDVPKDKVRWFSGDTKILNISNIELSVFEFSSEEIAKNEASKVSKDGFGIHAPVNIAGNTQNGGAVPLVIYISWSDNPHF